MSGGLVFPSLPEFCTVCGDTHSHRLWHSQKIRNRYFSRTLLLFDNPMDVDYLISGSAAFSKSSLNIWRFTVHILLKPGLENFEHYFASMRDDCNCAVVWTFLCIAFLRDCNENRPFPVQYEKAKYKALKDELPRSVGAQYATGDQWRNNSRKNEEMELKQQQHPVVDVTGDGKKVWCCKEQYCIGTWK